MQVAAEHLTGHSLLRRVRKGLPEVPYPLVLGMGGAFRNQLALQHIVSYKEYLAPLAGPASPPEVHLQ